MFTISELEDSNLNLPIRFKLSQEGDKYRIISPSTSETLDQRLLKIPNGSVIRFRQAIAIGTDLSTISFGIGVIGHITERTFETTQYGADSEVETTTFYFKVLESVTPQSQSLTDVVLELETPYVPTYKFPTQYPTLFDIHNYFDGDDAEIDNSVSYDLVVNSSDHSTPQVKQNIPFNSRQVLLSPQQSDKVNNLPVNIHLTNNGSSTFSFSPDEQMDLFFIHKTPDPTSTYRFVALEPKSGYFVLDFTIHLHTTALGTEEIVVENNSINTSMFNLIITPYSLSGTTYDYYKISIHNADRDYSYSVSDVRLQTANPERIYTGFSNSNSALSPVVFKGKDYINLDPELERIDNFGNEVRQVTQPYKTIEIPDGTDIASITTPGYYYKNVNVETLKSLPQEYNTDEGFVMFVYPKKTDSDDIVRYSLYTTSGTFYMANAVVVKREAVYDDMAYPDFEATESYSAGDIVWYGSLLKKFTTTHSGPWNDSHAVTTTLPEIVAAQAPTPHSADDIFILRENNSEVYCYKWSNAQLTTLSKAFKVWLGDNTELAISWYYHREVVWTTISQAKNTTTIHSGTDLAQLRVCGYYTGNGADLKNCPCQGEFSMIIYPDGTNYLLIDDQKMVYSGVNTTDAIQWTNINNRHASNILTVGSDLLDITQPGLYISGSASATNPILNSPVGVVYPFVLNILPNGLQKSNIFILYDSNRHVYSGTVQTTESTSSIQWEDVSDTDYVSEELARGTDLYTINKPGFYHSITPQQQSQNTESNTGEQTTTFEPPYTNLPSNLKKKMQLSSDAVKFSMLVWPNSYGAAYTIVDEDGDVYYGNRGLITTQSGTTSGSIIWNDPQSTVKGQSLAGKDLADSLKPGYWYAGASDTVTNSPYTSKAFRLICLPSTDSTEAADNHTYIAIANDGEMFIGHPLSSSVDWLPITGCKSLSSSQTGDIYTLVKKPGFYVASSGTYSNVPSGVSPTFYIVAIPSDPTTVAKMILISSANDVYVATPQSTLQWIKINTSTTDQTNWTTAYNYIKYLTDNSIAKENLKAVYDYVTTIKTTHTTASDVVALLTYISTIKTSNSSASTVNDLLSYITTIKTTHSTASDVVALLTYVSNLSSSGGPTAAQLRSLHSILGSVTTSDISSWNGAASQAAAALTAAQQAQSTANSFASQIAAANLTAAAAATAAADAKELAKPLNRQTVDLKDRYSSLYDEIAQVDSGKLKIHISDAVENMNKFTDKIMYIKDFDPTSLNSTYDIDIDLDSNTLYQECENIQSSRLYILIEYSSTTTKQLGSIKVTRGSEVENIKYGFSPESVNKVFNSMILDVLLTTDKGSGYAIAIVDVIPWSLKKFVL